MLDRRRHPELTAAIQPFECHVPDQAIADLKTRLALTRFPDQLEGAGWDYGTELTFLKSLCAYWLDGFDWRAAEARFNAFPQFTTEIGGEQVHFYHVRSPEPGALPLILTHGFPGSVAEFLNIIGPLSNPAKYGGNAGDAFHVVVPSIPGYGFSGPTKRKGFNIQDAGLANISIMEILGYDRYFVQGGDWGSPISTSMALRRPERVMALHLNVLFGQPADPNDPLAGLTDQERKQVEWMKQYQAREWGYVAIQSTKPQTLAYGLTDSPAGLAAWIVEKFRTWSDCGGEVERVFSKDQLLENIALYWFTGTINSAMRMYYESMGPGREYLGQTRVETPTGHACFPGEISPVPRAWADQSYNIVRWTDMPKGGHFAALEQPDLFVDEVRSFFKGFR